MKGTPKQIEWAEKIIAGWKDQVNNLLVEANTRVADGSMPEVWGQIMAETVEKATRLIDANEDAGAVIDIRKRDMAKIAFGIAKEEYAKIK